MKNDMLNPVKIAKATKDYMLAKLLTEHLAPPTISEHDWQEYLDTSYADHVDWCSDDEVNNIDIPHQTAVIQPMKDDSFRYLLSLASEQWKKDQTDVHRL